MSRRVWACRMCEDAPVVSSSHLTACLRRCSLPIHKCGPDKCCDPSLNQVRAPAGPCILPSLAWPSMTTRSSRERYSVGCLPLCPTKLTSCISTGVMFRCHALNHM